MRLISCRKIMVLINDKGRQQRLCFRFWVIVQTEQGIHCSIRGVNVRGSNICKAEHRGEGALERKAKAMCIVPVKTYPETKGKLHWTCQLGIDQPKIGTLRQKESFPGPVSSALINQRYDSSLDVQSSISPTSLS